MSPKVVKSNSKIHLSLVKPPTKVVKSGSPIKFVTFEGNPVNPFTPFNEGVDAATPDVNTIPLSIPKLLEVTVNIPLP